MKMYYLIYEATSECYGRYRLIAESLEEAESHVMEYTDWYCPMGTCSIHICDEHFNVKEIRYYREGKYVKS